MMMVVVIILFSWPSDDERAPAGSWRIRAPSTPLSLLACKQTNKQTRDSSKPQRCKISRDLSGWRRSVLRTREKIVVLKKKDHANAAVCPMKPHLVCRGAEGPTGQNLFFRKSRCPPLTLSPKPFSRKKSLVVPEATRWASHLRLYD